jgi:hypothetical protein
MSLGEHIHEVILRWREDGRDKPVVELLKDPFSPVPGTMQGGFRVRFVDL